MCSKPSLLLKWLEALTGLSGANFRHCKLHDAPTDAAPGGPTPDPSHTHLTWETTVEHSPRRSGTSTILTDPKKHLDLPPQLIGNYFMDFHGLSGKLW